MLGTRGQTPPSGKLNIAAIGIGGMGRNNIAKCAVNENIVALCDVDASERTGKIFALYPKAVKYRDYREMLDKQKDIDAIIIATPDHTHAVIGMAAIKAGKHVYMQKPMAHSVQETRVLTEAARQHKVVTQMGNQGHSNDGTRQICEWIWSGAIGKVKEVHAWTNRPVWPQGIEVERPKETPPVPEGFDWDHVDRPRAHAPVPSDLCAQRLAGVVGFRHGLAWRSRLPCFGSSFLGAQAGSTREHRRQHFHLLGRVLEEDRAEERNVSPLEHRAVQIPGARRHGAGHAHVVGWWADAAPPGGIGRRQADG